MRLVLASAFKDALSLLPLQLHGDIFPLFPQNKTTLAATGQLERRGPQPPEIGAILTMA